MSLQMDSLRGHSLHYLPEYRLLICKQCGYAVQPSGISSHLKERHQIYRQHRQQILEAVKTLDLADPEDVVLPGSGHAPIPDMPIDPGFACSHEICRYLSITMKRMRMHWSKIHGCAARDDIDWRRVHLQTFFRGIHLRYFEVAVQLPDTGPALPVAAVRPVDHKASQNERVRTSSSSEAPTAARLRDAENFTVADLRLWHHYVSSTSLIQLHDSHLMDCLAAEVNQISSQSLCLIRMVLALTSMHLAALNFTQQEACITEARRNYDLALICLDATIESAGNSTTQTIAACYKLIAIAGFASVSLGNNASLETQREYTLANVIIAIRSGYSWISLDPAHVTGLSSSMIEEGNIELPSLDERQCQFTKNFAFPSGFPETTPEQDAICYEAFCELQRAIALVKTPSRWLHAFMLWPSRVSDSYLLLLSLQHPTSLLIFGQFCSIVKLLDQYWYMAGHANWLLDIVRRSLDLKYYGMLPQSTSRVP